MIENDKAEKRKVFVLKKKYIIFTVLIVAAAALVIAVFSEANTNEISLFFSGSEQCAVAFRNASPSDDSMNGKSVSSVCYDSGKTSAAILMSEGTSYTLYYTNGKKCVKISENCTNKYVISQSGSYVMYCDINDELYIFEAENEKSKYIDNEVNYFALSPSGTYAVYLKVTPDGREMYTVKENKTEKINADYIPLALSDEIERIYVLSTDNALYMLNGKGEVVSKICSNVYTGKFCVSADMKSIVFSDGTYTYISNDGKSRVRLISHIAHPVNDDSGAVRSDSSALVMVYPSLTGVFYASENENETSALFYVDESFVRTDIAGNVKKYIFTENGTVYIDEAGKVYSYMNGKSTHLFTGASDIAASSDGKYIYCIDSSFALRLLKKGESEIVFPDAEKIFMTKENSVLVISSDKSLYIIKRAGKATLLDENVYNCICNSAATFYVKNLSAQTGSFELYASDTDNNFKHIDKNLNSFIVSI